ncbi:MAG: hypothetical protein K2Y23_16970 [Cyanobacteria bacterium]|nr:hypothetical protein [Cyanobacteriota bacterium]
MRQKTLLSWILASAMASSASGQTPGPKTVPLKVVDVKEAGGQILSYRHLAASTEVQMRGTWLAPKAQVKVKIGSRPGFVELDINRGGISGLQPAYRLGKDFLTYVLWAVSVDGKASNLGEITFEDDKPIPVNLTTPYQTFWLMVTAEPNYAVVDPSAHVVLYSVKQPPKAENAALPIKGDLFYFTHYAVYDTSRGAAVAGIPNQLLQARKAVELASKAGVLAGEGKINPNVKEEAYTHEALNQAKTFLARSEAAYQKDPKDQAVAQFARTSAQSAENARALAMGAVGGLVMRQLENELKEARNEVARLKRAEGAAAKTSTPPPPPPIHRIEAAPAAPAAPEPPPPAAAPALVKQPALWFAVAGWAVAFVLLFRRRSI